MCPSVQPHYKGLCYGEKKASLKLCFKNLGFRYVKEFNLDQEESVGAQRECLAIFLWGDKIYDVWDETVVGQIPK